VGLEGTGGLTDQDIEEALKLLSSVSVVSEALKLADLGATAMRGIFETLLEIGACSHTCMHVDRSKIPVPEVVQRFANAFTFDPLKMISSGTLVATLPHAAEKAFESGPCKLFRIGVVTEGEGLLPVNKMN